MPCANICSCAPYVALGGSQQLQVTLRISRKRFVRLKHLLHVKASVLHMDLPSEASPVTVWWDGWGRLLRWLELVGLGQISKLWGSDDKSCSVELESLK